MNTLSSLRAYVGGEGLWSKAQKDAVFHLYKYGVSRTEKDYKLLKQFMRVPIGDAKDAARAADAQPEYGCGASRVSWRDATILDDIDGMISLFVDFSNISYIKKAIDIWGDAQAMAMQLLPIAEELRAGNKFTEPVSGQQ